MTDFQTYGEIESNSAGTEGSKTSDNESEDDYTQQEQIEKVVEVNKQASKDTQIKNKTQPVITKLKQNGSPKNMNAVNQAKLTLTKAQFNKNNYQKEVRPVKQTINVKPKITPKVNKTIPPIIVSNTSASSKSKSIEKVDNDDDLSTSLSSIDTTPIATPNSNLKVRFDKGTLTSLDYKKSKESSKDTDDGTTNNNKNSNTSIESNAEIKSRVKRVTIKEDCRKLLRKTKEIPSSMIYEFLQYVSKTKWKKAIELCKKIISLQPENKIFRDYLVLLESIIVCNEICSKSIESSSSSSLSSESENDEENGNDDENSSKSEEDEEDSSSSDNNTNDKKTKLNKNQQTNVKPAKDKKLNSLKTKPPINQSSIQNTIKTKKPIKNDNNKVKYKTIKLNNNNNNNNSKKSFLIDSDTNNNNNKQAKLKNKLDMMIKKDNFIKNNENKNDEQNTLTSDENKVESNNNSDNEEEEEEEDGNDDDENINENEAED